MAVLGVLAAFLYMVCADASAFLSQAPAMSLLEELEAVLGSGARDAAEARALPLEDAMRPVFRALPKAAGDRLPWGGVRYLLHRVFVQRHGWQVAGIADDGAGFAAAGGPSEVVADAASAEAAALFERRHGGRGLTLHETAVLAATLETLVHDDVAARLRAAYGFAGVAGGDEDPERLGLAMDYYMLMYLLRVDHAEATQELLEDLQRNSRNAHVQETQRWARSVQAEVFGASAPELGGGFGRSVRAVEEVMDRYGPWQNYECEAIKADLVALEWNGTGRVRLQDFYAAAMQGNHLFSENKDYLREIGALDESEPSRPSVLIPNFLLSPANCLGGTRLYSVCCLSECERLYRPLEEHLGASEAPPERILELVQRLGSSSVAAPRALPEPLRRRLIDVADHHGGLVPLHGRLFAQWMHHAYPRECPYPHISGTTQHLTATQYKEMHGTSFAHNASTLHVAVEAFSQEDEGADDGEVASMSLPWSTEEELFVALPPRQWGQELRRLARWLMMVLAASSMSVATLRAAAGGQAAFCGQTGEKYTV